MNKKGRLFIISGPSGAGKSSLIGDALKELKNFKKSISVTTRAMRGNEKNGVEYMFVDDNRFEEMMRDDSFLEWAKYSDCYYGTPREFVEHNLSSGTNIILEIDVSGAMQVKKKLTKLT